jgi:hypothetical protein
VAFVKLYNKATAPVLASDVPAMILPVPAAVAGVPGVCTLPIGFNGFRFALGLGIAITGAVGDTDTTAVAAGQVAPERGDLGTREAGAELGGGDCGPGHGGGLSSGGL